MQIARPLPMPRKAPAVLPGAATALDLVSSSPAPHPHVSAVCRRLAVRRDLMKEMGALAGGAEGKEEGKVAGKPAGKKGGNEEEEGEEDGEEEDPEERLLREMTEVKER